MPKGYKKDGTHLGFQKGHIINNGRKHTEEWKCNAALGMVDDNIQTLELMIGYIKKV